METRILEMMRKNSQKKTPPEIVTPKTSQKIEPPKRYDRPPQDFPQNFHQNEDSRLARYLNLPNKIEIEVSFGTFTNNFNPGVSIFQFNSLMTVLMNLAAENRWNVSKKHTFEEISKGIRRIIIMGTEEHVVVWQRKIRKREDAIDNKLWGYRINKSEETYTDEIPNNFKSETTREKFRTSFFINDNTQGFSNVKLDLTKVYENQNVKYEVEIERTERTTLVNFKNAINFVIRALQRNLHNPENVINNMEREEVVKVHNSLFDKTGPLLFSNYWNKPTNLKAIDLVNPKNKFYVTLKIDGIRIFILITNKGTYACIPPYNIWKIGKGNKTFNGTLLDAEMYVNDDTVSYYVFDCLFSRGKDLRQNYFIDRLEESRHICDDTGFFLKKFYGSKDFYKNIEEAYDEYDKTKDSMDYDGFILQSSYVYRNNFTRKWKPPISLTIDFKLESIPETDDFYLLVKTEEGYERFRGDLNEPFTINIPGKILEINNTNNSIVTINAKEAIVECHWDGSVFVPERYRDDKEEPNFIVTANSVWQDINDPVTLATLKGNTLIAMRKFHNLVKKYFLETNFKKGDVINDWGSGRGGDISKWKKIGLSKVYAIEPNMENLEELIKRSKEMKYENIVVLSKGEGSEKAYIGAEEYNHVEKGIRDKLDGIVSFFSLTFFGKDMETFDNMITTIDRTLPIDKKFIGIVMDGQRVKELLGKENRYENSAFSIEKVSDFTDNIEEGENEIHIEIKEATSMVKYNEWLFYFDILVEKLKEKGIKLVTTGFLDEKGSPAEIDGPSIFKMLPGPGKAFSRLNRYFIFERYEKKDSPKLDLGKELGISKKFSLMVPTKNKDTSFLEAVMCSVDSSCPLLSSEERRKRAKILKKSMAKHVTEKFYEKMGENYGTFDEFKKMILGNELPVTVYADILSSLLKVNILIISGKSGKLKFDEERGLFGCYKNTTVLYERKGIYAVVIDNTKEKSYSCYKTKGTFVKKILEVITA